MSAEAIPFEELGRPIGGPGALTDDWARFWHLTYNIAKTQWKLRFFGSALGYAWQLVRPLLLFGVLYVFFTLIARIGVTGPGASFYGVQLLGSIVLFTFFAEATSGAVRSVLDSEQVVRKIQFPRLVIPLAVVLGSLFNLALNLIVVFIFALVAGVRPMLTWVELPLIIGMLTVLSAGFAMLLSSLYVSFRDVAPIWEVATQVLFYISPVIIPLQTVAKKVSPTVLHIYMLNPLAVVLQQFRHAIINNGAESAGAAIGAQALLLVPIAITLAVFALGFTVFSRTAPQVAENL